jgi:PAS domain S-box-containing protein
MVCTFNKDELLRIGVYMTSKILVVGVSEPDLSIIKDSLDISCVFVAQDNCEAMRYLDEDEQISIVILDLSMTNNGAKHLLKNLDSKSRYSEICIIILTQQDRLDDEILGMQLGATDYLRKPIQMESFIARIYMHLELLNQRTSQKQMDQKQMLFNAIFWQAPIGIAISYRNEPIDSSDNTFFDVNPMYEKITGRTKLDLMKLGWAKITHPDDLEEDLKNYRKLQSGELPGYSMKKRYIKPDGSIVWVHMTVAPLNIVDTHAYKHICLIQDITKRKEIEDALAESERSKSVLLANIPGMAYQCRYNSDWTMQYVSAGCLNLTGYTPINLIYDNNLNYNNLVAPEYRETVGKGREQAIEKRQPYIGEYEIITVDGSRKWVWEMGQGVSGIVNDVSLLEGIILDISNRKKLELNYNNEHDLVTGLYNHTYFEKLLLQEIKLKETRKRAIVSINLSSVHNLQIKYGIHYALDVIIKTAEALKTLCIDDCVLFQLQECQFVFYTKKYKDKSELLSFCESVSSTMESVLAIERIGWGVGVLELGLSERRDIERLQKNLLVASEKALVDFDNAESHVCEFDQELEHRMTREENIIAKLSEVASGKNPRRLFMHYQPILDLKTNRICGFEALARFKSRSLGLVSPLEFIPIAEKTKLIIPLGMLIIQQSLRFLSTLKSLGNESLKMSINISVIQLLHKDFRKQLLVYIRKNKIENKDVMLEITESVVSSEFKKINDILNELKSLGIKVALDDFGTGYSSLARERELDVDCLKIDKCFIDKLMLLKEDETITSDIISMAHKLGHFAIAEGVEHEQQMHYLKKHGCDYIQGYLISKPLDENSAISFLEIFKGNGFLLEQAQGER